MRISVVTLSFNQAAFLDRAIQSVLAQDHDDVEYIVVDPGSTDGSRDIIERYRDRLAMVLLDPDDGPADGLNKGFAKATGDIFYYLNADDAVLQGAFREAAAIFAKPKAPDVLFGHGYIIDDAGRVTRHFRSAPWGLKRFAHGASVQMQQSTFFTADIFRRIGGFNVDNRTCWDAEILLDFALAGARFKVVDRYWSLFTIYAESITGSGRFAEAHAADLHRMFKRIVGRDQRASDVLIGRTLRLARWFTDPMGAVHRLSDKLVGPPRPDLSRLLPAE